MYAMLASLKKKNGIKLKYKVRNSKKKKTKQQKTKEHMKHSYMYVYTRMIFAAVLSPAIKIFHWHLGPNLLIFAVKVSPWFHDISPRNTDQGDFLLKRAVGPDLTWIHFSWFKLSVAFCWPLMGLFVPFLLTIVLSGHSSNYTDLSIRGGTRYLHKMVFGTCWI